MQRRWGLGGSPLSEIQQQRQPREYTKVTRLNKTNQETMQQKFSNVRNTLQSFFTIRKETKETYEKNTESITGKIIKYEGVHLYQQTLTVKMQPLPMKEWFCPHNLSNNLRYIKRDLCNQNNTPRRILQAVLVTDIASAATISSSNTCIWSHCPKLNYTKTSAFHPCGFFASCLTKKQFCQTMCSVSEENSNIPNHQMRNAFAKTRSISSTLHSSLKIVLKSNICCI